MALKYKLLSQLREVVVAPSEKSGGFFCAVCTAFYLTKKLDSKPDFYQNQSNRLKNKTSVTFVTFVTPVTFFIFLLI